VEAAGRRLSGATGLTTVADGVLRVDAPLAIRTPTQINCYILRDAAAGGDLLVDTGMRESRATLEAAFDAAGRRPGAVLITHGHIDHWGGATAFADTVLAHPETRVELDFAAGRPLPHGGSVPVDGAALEVFAAYRRLVDGVPAIREIADGDLLGEWRALWTPGHAPGHLCLFRERDGVLIAGDQLLPDVTPNIQPGLGGRDALADFLASLERLAALPVRMVLPAHGEPFADARARARQLRGHHERRLQRLQALLGDGVEAVAELSARLFAQLDDDPQDRFLAQMETYAHLEHLRRRGQAIHRGDRWVAASGV